MKKLICISSAIALAMILACSDDDNTNPVDGRSQTTTWEVSYGGTNSQYGNSMVKAADGYLVTGYTWSGVGQNRGDVLLLKLSMTGELLWTKTYNIAPEDLGYSVVETSDGGYVVAGYASSGGRAVSNAFLLKVGPAGDSLWARTYGENSGVTANSVIATSDGGFLLVGDRPNPSPPSYNDIYVIKTDGGGVVEWELVIGGSGGTEYGHDAVEASGGGYVIAGSTNSLGHGSLDVYLIKVSPAGDTVWTQTYGGEEAEEGLAVERAASGGYVIAGVTGSFGAGYTDVYLLRVSAAGDSLWAKTFGDVETDWSTDVENCDDNGFILTGFSGSMTSASSALVLIRTDNAGTQVWRQEFCAGLSAAGASVIQASDGGFAAVGTIRLGDPEWEEVYVIKTDAEGQILE